MLFRKTKELAHTSTAIPLGQFLSVLKFRLQYKHGTTPDMSAQQVAVISLALGKHFQWCQTTGALRYAVIQPSCMINGKGPE
eukprot:scaffold61231_cov23-Cyclotella_meneghiniana.AAC.1